MNISIPYYEDLTRISNSNIGWFLQKGPAYLHKMLTDPPPEDKNPILERGSLIHMYLLQPEEFYKTYVVWDKSRPSSIQQEKFCQELANSVEIEPNRAILSAYQAAYSTKGKSEDTMLSEGLKIASTLKEYIDYLKDPERKQMISPSEYQMLKKIRNSIEAHKLAYSIIEASRILRDHKNDVVFENHHEFHINWGYKTIFGRVECKSLLDGLILDFKNKKAIIYDLKTTAKLWHFEESIDMYDYCRQLAYYSMAVRWYLVNECGATEDDIFEWEFKYYIIGIDTTGSNEIRVFSINKKFIDARYDTILDTLTAIAWHQSTGKWDHSREYYEGDGSETLNL